MKKIYIALIVSMLVAVLSLTVALSVMWTASSTVTWSLLITFAVGCIVSGALWEEIEE